MALVDYSSSEEDEGDAALNLNDPSASRAAAAAAAAISPTTNTTSPAGSKRKRNTEISSDLPPLPSKFFDLYASATRASTRDDPSLHGGRKRVTPHVEGNWPTHIYTEWYPSTVEHSILTRLISAVKDEVPSMKGTLQSFLTSDLGAPLPLHVSLSRPIGLVTEQKDGFVALLGQLVKNCDIRPFSVSFSSLDWVPNFEKTRWFLVLRLLKPPANGLNKLLYIINKAVQEFGQAPLYVENSRSVRDGNMSKDNSAPRKRRANVGRPSNTGSKLDWNEMQDVSDAFHISIAWKLQPPNQQILESTKDFLSTDLQEVKEIQFKIEDVKAKLGNVVTNIPLPKNVVERTNLFEF